MNSNRQQTDHPGLPRLVRAVFLITMMTALWLALLLPAGAQDEGPPPVPDYVSCGHFETQADAQAVLDSGQLDVNGIASLDGNGDGVACEEAFGQPDPNSPPPARDYVSCGHFETQADAQMVLDSGHLDANGVGSLDGDGDGIACEDAFASGNPEGAASTSPAPVTTLPKTGSGPVERGNLTAIMILASTMALASGATLRTRTVLAR